MPTLFCVNKTGKPSSNIIAIVTIIKKGEKRTSKISAKSLLSIIK